VFVCNSCGRETLKWAGQCPHCEAWNTLEARATTASAAPAGAPAALHRLDAVVSDVGFQRRMSCGQVELDRVLGGGLVPGSAILLGGEPGIGKSTLLLQVAASVAASQPVVYATGEESIAQVALRARRLSVAGAAHLGAAAETDLAAILALARQRQAALLVIDSIQTVQSAQVAGAPGSVAQLRECTAELVRFAKSGATAVLIIGHVTKEGTIAGPKLLEHLVDTVLYFESEASSRYRLVRGIKNRFGAVNELGFFAMTEGGLKEVRNPAAIFLARAAEPAPGSLVTVTHEGGRPLLIELQALAERMPSGTPRRNAQGLDAGRLAMLLAVLSRHAGLSLADHDVFVNAVGGIEVRDTGTDLPLTIALAGSRHERALPGTVLSFGEIGLTGEVRPVAYGEERLREAQKQGFKTAIVPRDNVPRRPLPGLTVIGVARVREGLEAAFSAPAAASPARSPAPS
jgi:DNA repair protein RadA/Sms